MDSYLDIPEPEPCIHSMIHQNCASCWHGAYERGLAANWRLRALIEAHGSEKLKDELAESDRYWYGGNAPESSKARWKD